MFDITPIIEAILVALAAIITTIIVPYIKKPHHSRAAGANRRLGKNRRDGCGAGFHRGGARR